MSDAWGDILACELGFPESDQPRSDVAGGASAADGSRIVGTDEPAQRAPELADASASVLDHSVRTPHVVAILRQGSDAAPVLDLHTLPTQRQKRLPTIPSFVVPRIPHQVSSSITPGVYRSPW